MGPPEKETPHPSELGGERGEAGQASTGMDGSAEDSARQLKARRGLRFRAQGQAARWLRKRAAAIQPGRMPGDVFRTIDCMWSQVEDVSIWRAAEFGTAHYKGLATCGSVWACPICTAKVQERRRIEVEQAMEWAKAAGLTAVMVTLTFPHRSFHRLADLLTKQADALGTLRRPRSYRALMASLGFRGLIRSLEVTHGDNGWHPHTHELWFIEPTLLGQLRETLAHMWAKACKRAGLLAESDNLPAFHVHSVDVKTDVTAGDYLTKQDDSRRWGLAHEVVKATSKQGRAKGVHPHHFLVRCGEGDDARFIEYAEGMKGRRQLFWSRGLKGSVGLGEVSDEEVAEEAVESAHHVATLTGEAWRVVRGNDARAEVLDAAEAGGALGVGVFLQSLGSTNGVKSDERRDGDAVGLRGSVGARVGAGREIQGPHAELRPHASGARDAMVRVGNGGAKRSAAEVLRGLRTAERPQASGGSCLQLCAADAP